MTMVTLDLSELEAVTGGVALGTLGAHTQNGIGSNPSPFAPFVHPGAAPGVYGPSFDPNGFYPGVGLQGPLGAPSGLPQSNPLDGSVVSAGALPGTQAVGFDPYEAQPLAQPGGVPTGFYGNTAPAAGYGYGTGPIGFGVPYQNGSAMPGYGATYGVANGFGLAQGGALGLLQGLPQGLPQGGVPQGIQGFGSPLGVGVPSFGALGTGNPAGALGPLGNAIGAATGTQGLGQLGGPLGGLLGGGGGGGFFGF